MVYLALDLGAGSGRAIVGEFTDGKICLDEVFRFDNKPVKLNNTTYWNFLSLFNNIKQGIYLAVKKGYKIDGIAVDTWGVDFGFLDLKGNLLSNPVTYRDVRTIGISDKALEKVTKDYLYKKTGIQQMEINTLFQLLSLSCNSDPSLSIAKHLLFMPDLINYFLTGKIVNEYTIASTSQMLNAHTKQWEKSILEKLDIPYSFLMNETVSPCSIIGELNNDIQTETKATGAIVYAVGSHDTASAIAAIPDDGDDWAFLSSGTWSLLGVETEEPVLTEKAMLNEFTNEGGVNDKILFMRNCTGLWLLQCLQEEWKKLEDEEISYAYLISEASKAIPFRSIINADDPSFTHPKSMTKAIKEYCLQTEQPVPNSKGELVRCILESLALKYLFVMDKLKDCSKKNINKLYVVGGGSQNEMLNQFISNALNMEVITGLTEATALGNILQQAIASKQIKSWKEAYVITKNSFSFKSYFPQNHSDWISIANKRNYIFELDRKK